jgi:hypothetical protein
MHKDVKEVRRGEVYEERRERIQLNNALKRELKRNTCWT